MQPAPSTRIPDGFLAAMRLEGEKPHQGLPSRNPAPNPVREVCKFTVLLGMRGQAELNRAGSCCTGKERDTESGNDYFMARYYSSSMGRFLSPDWSAKVAPVPYAKLDNPQTLNLYAYMVNNPLGGVDADGHLGCKGSTEGFCNPAVQENMRKGMDSFSALGAAQQQSIASVAKGAYENDHGYYSQNQSNGAYPAGVKCNEFVSDAVQKSGKARPRVPYGGLRGLLGMTRDPTAAEWANPSVGIPGWSKPMPVSAAEPGDVIAQQHGEHGGHAGIVVEGDYGGLYSVSVSSRTQVPGTLVMNSWGFQSSGNGEGPGDPAPVVRQPLADLP
jgi:RHS repeat-associated protein